MNVKVLGASGFVGKNLINYMPEATGISLRDPNWEMLIKNSEVIINLVGKAHDLSKKACEYEYRTVNVELTKDIYHAFLRSNAYLLIHISSIAAVEELESKRYLTEEDNCQPTSYYGKTKREAEIWLLRQPLPVGKKIIILRPPMIHGPGDKGNLGLLYKFISSGVPYPLYSFINKRSFISVSNFNYFINEIITKRDFIQTGVYHLADDEFVSTNELVNLLKDSLGKNTPNISFPRWVIRSIASIGDILPIPINSRRLKKLTASLLVSNSKIKNMLKIEKLPITAIEGLALTIESLKNKKSV